MEKLNMEKSEIKAIFRRLDNHQENLSSYQVEFVKGLKKYYAKNNRLSPKQIDALININSSVMVEK
ncbi:MAG: hypothetical protein ACM3UT_10300 [Chloroflexota bacterium]